MRAEHEAAPSLSQGTDPVHTLLLKTPVANRQHLVNNQDLRFDGDGDGKFSSARSYAKQLLNRLGPNPPRLLEELEKYDEAVCVQAASLYQSAGGDIRAEEFMRALKSSSEPVRRAFAAYAATLP